MPNEQRERILVVESDPVVSDTIARQALQAAGYQAQIAEEASSAIAKAIQEPPDLIIANLNLPGLSGKDMMVALSSQGLEIPVIVVGKKGNESDIIQAFRLGAVDYLTFPIRETEVISVVERVLKAVRERRERERLDIQLATTNEELQSRVRELTTIYSIGKAVTSITDHALLFEKIVDASCKVTQAELGWFLLRDENSKNFLLVAQHQLPPSLAERLNQSWDDSISSLVAMSGEALSIHGDPIKRFKIASLGESALIVPIRAQRQVIGLLVVMRKKDVPFSPSDQGLLEAVSDYASISLVNAHLFRAVNERARTLQVLADNAIASTRITNELLKNVQKEMRGPLEEAHVIIDRRIKDPRGKMSSDQSQGLSMLIDQINNLAFITDSIEPLPGSHNVLLAGSANLTELTHQAVARYKHHAKENDVTIVSELPQENIIAQIEPGQFIHILYGLLSNAIKYSTPGAKVTVQLERSGDNMAHLVVIDTGTGIDARDIPHMFVQDYVSDRPKPRRFGGMGIGLNLVNELVTGRRGKVWVESKLGQGARFHVLLPVLSANSPNRGQG
jgi:signal transduction histidine kinase/DNA-binding response OmpR family regulator